MRGNYTNYVTDNSSTSESGGRKNLKENYGWQTKLPKLKITSFKGAAGDWVRFENMFLFQVDAKSIIDEEKFGYNNY